MIMRHFFEAHTYQAVRSHPPTRALVPSRYWQVFGLTAILCLGFAAEGLALTTSRTALTFHAVQGGPNPYSQLLYVYRSGSTPATLTTSDNATWLWESPQTATIKTTSAKVIVNCPASGLGAGTYKANITIKMGTWGSKVVPVTLIVSPATVPPPSSSPPVTSTATLTWNAVTSTSVSGYKVYVGEAPHLYSRTVTVGKVTSSTVNSLTVGRMYYFAVTAYNSAGESTPSNEVSKTIQ
ncbi:MAG TPA: fibronectin type III domain-containing protein [Nitrospira sp.]|nr:fibronectin type III domain-containing protein [Nitrospira sp.]